MNKQEGFFSPRHERLLNIATWAKSLAWTVLAANIFYAMAVYVQKQAQFSYIGGSNGQFGEFLKTNFLFAVSLGIEIVSVALKGIVYFLLLKSVSLGLNMIVETDINYRDKNEQGGMQ